MNTRRRGRSLSAFAGAVFVVLAAAPAATAGLLVTARDDGPYTVLHDRVLTVSAGSGVLDNDSGLLVTAAKRTNPGHGTVTVSSNGAFTYRPAAGYVGADSFTYDARVLNLGILVTDTGRVTINVTNPNAPTAANDHYNATTGVQLSVSAAGGVLANDADGDGDDLTAVLVDGGGNGSLDLNANGSFTFTSGGSFTGNRTFTYRASDGVAASATKTVTITVTAPAPTATPTPAPTPAPTPKPTPAPTAAPTATPKPTATATPAPTGVPTPTATPRPTATARPSATPTPRPAATPTVRPSATPTTPPFVPTAAPSLGATPTPGGTATPAPTSAAQSPSPSASIAPPPGSPAVSASPSASAATSASPTAVGGVTPGGGGTTGGGTTGGAGPALPAGGSGLFTVPTDAFGGGLAIDTGSLVFGGFEWAVPAVVLTVPGLLLLLAIAFQAVFGSVWLPVARRWLDGDRRRGVSPGPAPTRGRRAAR